MRAMFKRDEAYSESVAVSTRSGPKRA